MDISITKTMKRKTHTPSGERGKTVCGKRVAPTVPITAERPGCKVCAVVYDQAVRGVTNILRSRKAEDKGKNFAHGFAFALASFERNWPGSHSQLFDVFQEAGYELADFENIDFDETDRKNLNRIFGV
jgi:hypothetical protein